MAEPRIYSRNWIDGDCIINSSHGGTKENIFDRSSKTYFTTTGANNDATEFEITIEFTKNGNTQYRPIDTLLLDDHNFKAWTLYYWNGSSWVSLASQTGNSVTAAYLNFSLVSTTAVKLTCSQTMAADDEKYFGEMILCNLVIAANDLSAYNTKWREKSKEIVLGDGAIHRVITRAVSGRTGRYEARCRWSYVSAGDLVYLKNLKEKGEPFYWQPESVTSPYEFYYVHWTNAWDDKYMSNYKGAGYEVVMDLKEV